MGIVMPILALISFVAPAHAASAHAFNSGMNCNGVWRLPDTGQTGSYTATVGEDHDYQPAASQPNYTVLNPVGISSVTVDNRTGLMWMTNPRTDAGFDGKQTWESALTSCTVTMNGAGGYAGYTDWRLPNVRELMSIVNYGASSPSINTTAFPGTQTATYYWTNTTSAAEVGNAWGVIFGSGTGARIDKTTSSYVRCVRAETD